MSHCELRPEKKQFSKIPSYETCSMIIIILLLIVVVIGVFCVCLSILFSSSLWPIAIQKQILIENEPSFVYTN